MRTFAAVFAILFALCVALQYNDPDPFEWIAIYGFAMLVSVAFAAGRPLRFTGFSVALIALVWAAYLVPGFWGKLDSAGQLVATMKAEQPQIELAREFGGLLIVALVMVVLGLPTKAKSVP